MRSTLVEYFVRFTDDREVEGSKPASAMDTSWPTRPFTFRGRYIGSCRPLRTNAKQQRRERGKRHRHAAGVKPVTPPTTFTGYGTTFTFLPYLPLPHLTLFTVYLSYFARTFSFIPFKTPFKRNVSTAFSSVPCPTQLLLFLSATK